MSRVDLGIPAPHGNSPLSSGIPFPVAARTAVTDTQTRRNISAATATIRGKRHAVVSEVSDWEELRQAGQDIKRHSLAHLDDLLVQLEQQVTARGGTVHWAADAAEANRIIGNLIQSTGATEVVKVKSMVTQEIGLNEALAERGIDAWETDLAELIVQLAEDKPSHIVVPAIHRNRSEIRDIFAATIPGAPSDLRDEPTELAATARTHLRHKMLNTKVAVSGANFAVAETGALAVVESEGNGRMCLTLPETLITVMGIEKVIPTWRDLEVFLQLLPRSATGERMNPYTSMWTGVHPGDGPREFHLVLLDNGRVNTLADEVGREALHCIRCAACLNVCPVYERTGGHAYGSVYPGPIGAVLTPQLTGIADNPSLPYASTLCGACLDACPVRIDIPAILVHLRAEATAAHRLPTPESTLMATSAWMLRSPSRFAAATRLLRLGRLLRNRRGTLAHLPPPLSAWTDSRDLPAPPRQTFRTWWRRR